MNKPGKAANTADSSRDDAPARGPALRAAIRCALHSLMATIMPARCLGCGHVFTSLMTVRPPADEYIGAETLTEPVACQEDGFNRITVRRSARTASPTEPLDRWVCPVCIAGWEPVASPFCSVCGMPFKSREVIDHECGECLRSPKNFRMARAAAVYTPLAMTLLHGFKYNGKIQLAVPFGAFLATSWLKTWAVEEFDIVLPVPLHRRRFRRRGFNQAYLLVESLMQRIIEKTGKDSVGARIERAALRRARATASQTGLRRKGRLENIRNAFEVIKPAVIADKRVLLVDDIYTTGATVNECARVLRQSGAAWVDVLTVARAI